MKAVLLVENCSAHKIGELDLPNNLKLLFFPANVTSTRYPADMGMVAFIKVGYNIIVLTLLLNIFDSEGGYESAHQYCARQACGAFHRSVCLNICNDDVHNLDEHFRSHLQNQKYLGGGLTI